jgi:hypothetical protein
VLTIKISPPLLIAPLVLVFLRPRSLKNWACMSAGALTLFSLACRVQIGVRFMLPLVALAVVGLAAGVVQTCAESGLWRRRLLGGAATAGLAWTACSALLVWPQALCYVNAFWGGTPEGYLLVSEANYDWGQGLKELARWQEQQQVPLAVWYYGTDPAVKSLPVEQVPLHTGVQSPEDVQVRVKGRYLAVSTSLLYGATGDFESMRTARAYLRTCRPVARTSTFLIFDFTQP